MSDREMYCRDCDRSIYGKYHDCDVNIENGGKYVMADDKCYCKIVDGKMAEKYPWEKSEKEKPMSNEFTITLNSPITEEQWDMITDVDFDNTNEITFHTKHGKEVKFVKASVQPEPYRAKREPMAKTEISIPNATPTTVTNSWTIARYWIPCNRMLPEKPYGCIVTVCDTNPMTMEEFENILPYFVGFDGERWNDADGEECPFEVLAWMPLPEPYQPKEDEE